MTMSRSDLSRRKLLAGLVGAGAAARLLPFLPATVGAAAAPKRLLVVFSPMGYFESSFWPTGGAADGTGWTIGETMTALAPWKDKLIYPDGLDNYGAEYYFPDDENEHGSGMAMIFTASHHSGSSEGQSIDGLVADTLWAQQQTKYKSLNLGVNAPTPGGHTSCFFSKARTPVNAQNDPAAVFASVFNGVTAGGGGMAAPDTAAFARGKKQKQSVIDLVKGDLARVCAGVGAEDKRKCDAHLDAVRTIEQRLASSQATPPPTLTGCVPPAAPKGGDLVAQTHAQMDLITAAFSCDLTRVATLQLGFCDGGLDPLPGLNQHDTTHSINPNLDPTAIANHKKFDRWFADRWAYLFGRLSSVQEGNGTLLDNTLVLFGSDTTTGVTVEQGAHCLWRTPLWMAGGGNFAFKTGRRLVFTHPKDNFSMATVKGWTPVSRLHVSIARAFGAQIDTFGNMDPGSGPLAGL
jgi:hypothetical protein